LAKKSDSNKNIATSKLNFNCKGSDPLEEKNSFHNKDPNSYSCKFVFSIFGRKSMNDFDGIFYSLLVTGNNVIKTMPANSSMNL